MTEARVPIDLRRRSDARLQVSRIAAELFWRDGLAATRGEDIAREAGIATRTLWRYFRSKEACVEPVLVESGRVFESVLHGWPLDRSIEEYLEKAATPGPVVFSSDDVAAMRMIVLGYTEPALRSAWLMVCDAAEQRSTPVFAPRLNLPRDAAEVRRVAASVSGAIRALTDGMSIEYVENGVVPESPDVLRTLAAVVRDASNGRIGPAI
ncbi:regulatory TetR family protein [Diaminobutyricimonas aerilata]|uniref:Regulatory TetR family protein n=1 Tax=Diaminobutyricimonas aerilata TaxID=1162967 RepID=A0A2M9CP30_9MICO|nr:helix-turn-helix domain-containing protein [Diaminobutyricimonas aerilata]PJJ73657.1 regulatory TetR family protein [Diaminobutyricimonas aerilata]